MVLMVQNSWYSESDLATRTLFRLSRVLESEILLFSLTKLVDFLRTCSRPLRQWPLVRVPAFSRLATQIEEELSFIEFLLTLNYRRTGPSIRLALSIYQHLLRKLFTRKKRIRKIFLNWPYQR